MTENNGFARRDLAVDRDMEVDCDIGQEITAYIETWFDVDKKFGTHTADDDSTWVNLYAAYNPFSDSLMVGYEIDYESDPSEWHDYEPTAGEAQLIKDMITEKIRELYDRFPIDGVTTNPTILKAAGKNPMRHGEAPAWSPRRESMRGLFEKFSKNFFKG